MRARHHARHGRWRRCAGQPGVRRFRVQWPRPSTWCAQRLPEDARRLPRHPGRLAADARPAARCRFRPGRPRDARGIGRTGRPGRGRGRHRGDALGKNARVPSRPPSRPGWKPKTSPAGRAWRWSRPTTVPSSSTAPSTTCGRSSSREFIVVALVCAVFLFHLRSALVAVVTLARGRAHGLHRHALAGVNANILSLGGVAIALARHGGHERRAGGGAHKQWSLRSKRAWSPAWRRRALGADGRGLGRSRGRRCFSRCWSSRCPSCPSSRWRRRRATVLAAGLHQDLCDGGAAAPGDAGAGVDGPISSGAASHERRRTR